MHPVRLPPTVRRRLESLLGADLSSVRIRVSHRAAVAGAQAYTRGETIVFAPGHYDPHSREGFARLAHEMTHVIQQREGRTPAHRRGLFVDAELEAEADANARRATASPYRWAPRKPATVSVRAPRVPRPVHAPARPAAHCQAQGVAQPLLGYQVADSLRDFGTYLANGFWSSARYVRDGTTGVLGYGRSALWGFGGYVAGGTYGAGAYLASGPAYIWRGVAGAAAFGWRGMAGAAQFFRQGRAGRTWGQYAAAGAFDVGRYLTDGVLGTGQYMIDGLSGLDRAIDRTALYGIEGVIRMGAFGWTGARQAAAFINRGAQGVADFLGRGLRAGRREIGYFRLGAMGMGAAAAAAAVYGLPLSALVPLVQSFAPHLMVSNIQQLTPSVVAAAIQALGGVLTGHPVLTSALLGASIPYAVDLMHFYRFRYFYTPERHGYHTLARHSAWHTRWNITRRLVRLVAANAQPSAMQDWTGQHVRRVGTSSQFRSESWHAYSVQRANEHFMTLHPGATILDRQPANQRPVTERFTMQYPGWDVGLSHTAAGTQVVDYVFSNFIERRGPGGAATNEWFLVQHFPQAGPAPNNNPTFVPWYRYFL